MYTPKGKTKKTEDTKMKETGIKRYEDYTETA